MIFLSRYGGEVLKEKGDEQMSLITFLCESFEKNNFLSSFRPSKAFDAQNGTAEEWTVGPYSDDLMYLWSHALAMRTVITLSMESCEKV